jgi:hypothetical protein
MMALVGTVALAAIAAMPKRRPGGRHLHVSTDAIARRP